MQTSGTQTFRNSTPRHPKIGLVSVETTNATTARILWPLQANSLSRSSSIIMMFLRKNCRGLRLMAVITCGLFSIRHQTGVISCRFQPTIVRLCQIIPATFKKQSKINSAFPAPNHCSFVPSSLPYADNRRTKLICSINIFGSSCLIFHNPH